jgi:hypothetical protein
LKLCFSLVSLVAALSVGHTQTPSEWKTTQTGMGLSMDAPGDTRLNFVIGGPVPGAKPGVAAAPVTCEGYFCDNSKSHIIFTKLQIPKDEDAKDSDAVRLENVVYNQVHLEKDKVTAIRYSVTQGWPTVDLDISAATGATLTTGGVTCVVAADTGIIHYRVCRAKTEDFEVVIYGSIPKDDRQKVLDSITLPKETGKGDLTEWGPVAQDQSLSDSHVDVWTPIKFREDKDTQEESGPDARRFKAEFSYIRLYIEVVPLPDEAADQIDDAALDEILKAVPRAEGTEDGQQKTKAKLDDIQSYTSDLDRFRYLTYSEGTEDSRVDVAIKNNVMYLFFISVPHGMFESRDIKKFIASYRIH